MMRLFVVFLMLSISFTSYASLSGDFDSNDSIDTDDVAILIAWIQESTFAQRTGGEVTLVNVNARAGDIVNKTVSAERFPSEVTDNFGNRPRTIDTEDVAIMVAYIQENSFAIRTGGSFDMSDVKIRASGILSLSAGVGKLPATPIGDSSFTTTIDGITPD